MFKKLSVARYRVGWLPILACLGLLWATPTFANPTCQLGPSGKYLRADGNADQPWSIKVRGKPVVYVEQCLIEQLLSFFPTTVHERRFVDNERSRNALQPAAWKTRSGEAMVALSPESRFQVAAAILYIESAFHPNVAPSSAGAIGPFQVLPSTGDQMGLDRVENQRVNMQAGLKYILYIEEQIARYCDIDDSSKEGSTRYRVLIAASYNAGPGYMMIRDQQGQACRLEEFPRFSRTVYLDRFHQALGYQYLPARLQFDPDRNLLPRRGSSD